MKKLIWILLFILSISTIQTLNAQKQPRKGSNSSKAIAYFDKGTHLYDMRQNNDAITELKKAVKEDPDYVDAHMMLAEIYRDMGQKDLAIQSYKEVIRINPSFFPPAYCTLAKLELSIGNYQEAYEHAQAFINYPKQKESLVKDAQNILDIAEFSIHAIEHPVLFDPQNLGENINSEYSEYLPAISADDSMLVFTVLFPKTKNTIQQHNKEEEDLYVSYKKNGEWMPRSRLPEPLNSFGNEGAQCLAPDGQTVYFTACNREDGIGSCDIYVSKKQGNSWTQPINLGVPVNTPYWETQPSIASDGRTLYFLSNRPGGFGDADIWRTYLQDDGTWTVPENLGDSINTPKKEMSPYIHPDNHTLYFASSGHVGMGGLDVFYSRMDENGKWHKPVNLGYPINTFADEVNLIVSAKGDKAYFSSDREGGFGQQDLYAFDLYPEARPVLVTYMKGKVYDAATKAPLEAYFEVVDLASGKIAASSTSDVVTGNYLVSLPSNAQYALNVAKEGYLFFSETFDLKGINSQKPYYKDIPLHKLEIGASVVLKNIFFATAKSELKEESKVELQKIMTLLKNNPALAIEISGYTDNVGNPEANKILSTQRALSVYNYLIQNGIDKSKLTYKGYGETQPIDTNNTEEGRANNRRTEFKIIRK